MASPSVQIDPRILKDMKACVDALRKELAGKKQEQAGPVLAWLHS